MALFLCIEAVVLVNLLVAVLGDGFNRLRENEGAIRLYNYALFVDGNRFTSVNDERFRTLLQEYVTNRTFLHCLLLICV